MWAVSAVAFFSLVSASADSAQQLFPGADVQQALPLSVPFYDLEHLLSNVRANETHGHSRSQRLVHRTLVPNGDFETGNFASWTASFTGTGYWFVDQQGTTTPVGSARPVPFALAGGGTFYAVTDQGAPSSQILYQPFTVPAGATVTVSFSFYIDNFSTQYATQLGPVITHTAGTAEYARVDILNSIASPFSIGPEVVQTLFDAGCWPAGCNVAGAAGPNPWNTVTFDISSAVAAGGTFYIRFSAAITVFVLNFGIDNVDITVAMPLGTE